MQALAAVEGGILGAALGWLVTREILLAVAGGLVGAALGGRRPPALVRRNGPGSAGLARPHPGGVGGRRPGRYSAALPDPPLVYSERGAARTWWHHGPSHSLLCLGLTTAVGLLLRATVTWWALPLGVLSHLMLDTLTWGGVPWLWPWKRHFRARWALHAGSWVENAVIFPMLLITAVVAGLARWPAGGLHQSGLT